eukprot:TRINITY_DN91496_c0_g1_i1.p1 TRINITY_DN91496_c0_g1~~TRINITY_DN91496_c0_g1_i1.p1  ORF type:complete len:838 (+),score=175.09 TRINITY_DN91496_c0_g1_i1:151-2664(+)
MFNWHAVASRAQLDLGAAAARERHQEQFLRSIAKPPVPPDARKLWPSSSNRSSDAKHMMSDDEVHSDPGSDSEESLVLSESTEGWEGLESPQAELLETEVEDIISPRDVLIADLQMKCALLETEGFQLREKVLQLEAERERDRAAAAAVAAARRMGSPVSSPRSSSPACSPASCVLLSEVVEASDPAGAKPGWLAEAELSGPEWAKPLAEVEEGLAELQEAADVDPCGAGQAELSGASVFLVAEVESCLAAEPEPATDACEAAEVEQCRETGAKRCQALEEVESEEERHDSLETRLVLSAEPYEAAEVAATTETPPVDKQSLLSYLPPAMERARPNFKRDSATGTCKAKGGHDSTGFALESVIPACPAGHGPLSLVSSAVPWICDTCDHFHKYSNHGFVEPRYHCSHFGCSFANSCKECAILNTEAWYDTKGHESDGGICRRMTCPPGCGAVGSEANSSASLSPGRASETCATSGIAWADSCSLTVSEGSSSATSDTAWAGSSSQPVVDDAAQTDAVSAPSELARSHALNRHCGQSTSDPSSSSSSKVSSDQISDPPPVNVAVLSEATPESPRGLAPLPHAFDSKLMETLIAGDVTPATSATGSAPAELSRSCSPIRQVVSQVDMHGGLESSSRSSQPSTSARFVCDQSSTYFGCSQPATPRSGANSRIVWRRSIQMPATHESYLFAFSELALPLMKVDLGSAYASFEGVNALFTKIHGVPCGSALYNMACCLSMGSSANPTVPGAAGLPPYLPVDDVVNTRLELAALLLRSAVGAGYTDMPHMLTDPDLQTLRNERPSLLATFWQQLDAQKGTPRPVMTCSRANASNQVAARAVLA